MELEEIYKNLGISREVLEFGSRTEAMLKTRFEEIDSNAEYNQLKVIAAMQKNRVSDIHFSGTTGYGYMISAGRHWNRCTQTCSTQRMPWYARRLPAEHTRFIRPWPAICARVTNFCHQSENHTTRWRKSSASGRRTVH